jgi:hypothetical protein
VREVLVRFLVGGVFVSAFALLGDFFKPKSFAGLFAAAPSVALATLILATLTKGSAYAQVEARSMVGGAFAFFIYTTGLSWYLHRHGGKTLLVVAVWIGAWAGMAAGAWVLWLRPS